MAGGCGSVCHLSSPSQAAQDCAITEGIQGFRQRSQAVHGAESAPFFPRDAQCMNSVVRLHTCTNQEHSWDFEEWWKLK